jgi:CheY-like chemotaxis protein
VSSPSARAVPPVTVLIAEPNPRLRGVLLDALQDEGLAVVTVAAGRDVPAVAREQRPDLVVVDRQLPGTSGLDVLEALHHDPVTRDVPILLTSHLQPDARVGQTAAPRGAFNVDLFVEQVWRLLNERLQADWRRS